MIFSYICFGLQIKDTALPFGLDFIPKLFAMAVSRVKWNRSPTEIIVMPVL